MYPAVERFGISSRYGPRPNLMGDFHHGTDVPCPVGTDLVSITDGTVVKAGPITFTYAGKSYTEIVLVVNRPDGRFNIYDHLSQVLVKAGDRVNRGQLVARSGKSGYVTGPHWHCQKGIGQYKVNTAFASYATEDPEPELRAWTLLGGSTDVTPEQDFSNIYIAVAYRWPTPEETQAWRASGLEPYAWVQQHAPNPAVEAEKVRAFQACWITLAWRWPTDEETRAWQQSGMSAYEFTQKNAPSPALEDAKIQTFRESWITRATEWPTKTTIDDWQHTSEPAYSYVQHHAPSPTETSLNQQIEQISRNNTDLHLELENQDKQIEADALLMKSLEAQIKALKEGKPVDGVEVPEKPVEGETPSNGGLLGWIIELIQQIFGGTKK